MALTKAQTDVVVGVQQTPIPYFNATTGKTQNTTLFHVFNFFSLHFARGQERQEQILANQAKIMAHLGIN